MRPARITFMFILLFTIAALGVARADEDSGAIAGVVKDKATGEGLDGVTVVITSKKLNGQRTAITENGGRFRVTSLPPGSYTVKFYFGEVQGIAKNVRVSAKHTAQLYPKLDTSQGGEVVTIKGRPHIDTTMTRQGIVIDRDFVKNIPVPGRTFHATSAPTAGRSPSYPHSQDSRFVTVTSTPVSTFALDVDTASYANTRRFLREGMLPPVDAVKLEEMVNYFDYELPEPTGPHPVSLVTELSSAPWNAKHQLLRISLRAKATSASERSANNLIFLVDSSGSMQSPDKLLLVKEGLRRLASNLGKEDRMAIVTYAGAAGVVLPPTSGSEQDTILAAIDDIEAGGSTAGGAGIELAYRLAKKSFSREKNNRIILATDGDFNVGVSDEASLYRLIEKKRKSGVFLTVIGVGHDNYQDDMLEGLANKGNGSHYYIDSASEARRIFGKELQGTLYTVAKDVKLQLEFNPQQIARYRLLGYARRRLAASDFDDDKKDAGEIGEGHTVTAFYELIPASKDSAAPPLRYGKRAALDATKSAEIAQVKLRYKRPHSAKSKLAQYIIGTWSAPLSSATRDYRWASAVADFALFLRSEKKPRSRLRRIETQARAALGSTPSAERKEFLELLRATREITEAAKSP